MFAYVVRFFPQALAGVGLGAADASARALEEAARGLGRGPLAALATVTAAARCAPGCCAGAALVFLSAMKELPGDAAPAPDRVRDARDRDLEVHAAGAYSRAAPAALLLIVVSAPFVYCCSRATARVSERRAAPG